MPDKSPAGLGGRRLWRHGKVKTWWLWWLLPGDFDQVYIYTLWLFNIAMESGPFTDDFPMMVKTC